MRKIIEYANIPCVKRAFARSDDLFRFAAYGTFYQHRLSAEGLLTPVQISPQCHINGHKDRDITQFGEITGCSADMGRIQSMKLKLDIAQAIVAKMAADAQARAWQALAQKFA